MRSKRKVGTGTPKRNRLGPSSNGSHHGRVRGKEGVRTGKNTGVFPGHKRTLSPISAGGSVG